MNHREADQRFADIRHISSTGSELPPLPAVAERPTYCVFWSDDRPVGDLWVDPGSRLHEEVVDAINVLTQRPDRPAGGPTPSTVTLVIPTRDRPDQLERCLTGLRSQTRRPDEVIVVDNASRGSETYSVATRAGVRYVREERPGLDIARNAGLRASTSELIAFTDDDTEMHPRWLERLVAAFDQDGVEAVTGLVLPAQLATGAQWTFERTWGFGRGFRRIDYDDAFYQRTRSSGCPAWRIGAGANMALRREAVDRVGSFDERLDVGAAGCSGDSEFWYRILAAGGTCRYEPSAVVFHHHRSDDGALASQLRHYMRGHVTALLIQYEKTRDRGNLVRAFRTLPIDHARRVIRSLLRRRQAADEHLLDEILGWMGGVVYYLRHRRPRGRSTGGAG